MGMPGFSGFIAEISILLGAWKAFPSLLIFAAIGAIITVAFTLRALQRTFFPAHGAAIEPHDTHEFEPISLPEKLGALLLMAATLGVGLFPKILLDPIIRSFESPQSLMHHLIQGVAK